MTDMGLSMDHEGSPIIGVLSAVLITLVAGGLGYLIVAVLS